MEALGVIRKLAACACEMIVNLNVAGCPATIGAGGAGVSTPTKEISTIPCTAGSSKIVLESVLDAFCTVSTTILPVLGIFGSVGIVNKSWVSSEPNLKEGIGTLSMNTFCCPALK